MATSNTNPLASVISTVGSGKKFPAISLVRDNPDLAAALSKLISPKERPRHDSGGFREITAPDQSNFAAISSDIAQKTKDAESINQLFPDMDLSAQILISSILSPKDMAKVELTYIAGDSLKSAELTAILINKIKDYFEQVYKIEPLLPKILRQVLFESGSYPVAIIPENSVDDLINGGSRISVEAISEIVTSDGNFKNIGILGNSYSKTPTTTPKKGLSIVTESFSFERFTDQYEHKVCGEDGTNPFGGLVTVTDNHHALKLSKLLQKKRSNIVSSVIRKNSRLTKVSTESSLKKMTDVQLSSILYKTKNSGSKNFVKIKTNDELGRKPIGAPLVMKLPSEAVIPVFTPGNEEQHVGYFVLIDSEGNPLNKNSNTNHFDDLQMRVNNSTNNMSSYLLNQAKKTVSADCTNLTSQQATRVYADIIEADLLARLRNGINGSNVMIARNEEVYRIMLARTFQNQYTQLVYIPIDLVTYFAYKYDNRGIGKSLLDDMRILNSLRAMVLFSKVMATIKNSIGRTQVALKLDEKDPNPQKTIETAIHEVSKTRQQYFPLGLSTPGDLVDWVQKSGYEYTFTGHPGLPDTSIEFSEKSSSYTPPDTDLEDDLRKRAIMATGLSPETVDSGFSAEFATTVVANNILLAKRVLQIQEVFIPQITDYVKKLILNNGSLMQELKETINTNLDKIERDEAIDEEVFTDNTELIIASILSTFLEELEVSLPQPNSITLENQMAAFDTYVESLDKALNFYISSEILTSSFAGEAAERADELKNIVKAYFCRKWLNENNVLPELTELTIQDENGDPLLDFASIQSDHINGMVKSVITVLSKTHPVGVAAGKDIENITNGAELADSEVAPPSTDTGDSGGFSNDFGDLGDTVEDTTDGLGGTDTDLPDLDKLV